MKSVMGIAIIQLGFMVIISLQYSGVIAASSLGENGSPIPGNANENDNISISAGNADMEEVDSGEKIEIIDELLPNKCFDLCGPSHSCYSDELGSFDLTNLDLNASKCLNICGRNMHCSESTLSSNAAAYSNAEPIQYAANSVITKKVQCPPYQRPDKNGKCRIYHHYAPKN